ncbi:MAG: class I SAM-dependent methyltransferase [Methanotrichaceae archaeon]
MSIWTDHWRSFVSETSYLRILREKGISNDQFWQSYQIYDEVLRRSGYPGEILTRISSYIRPEDVLLDIGAGTGAFAVPLARIADRIIAIDPSDYHLGLLSEKAEREKLKNIIPIANEWRAVNPSDIGMVDYSLAAYSLFDLEIEAFLRRMIDIASKGVFIVFRAGKPDSLNEFVYGIRPSADYKCLCHILDDLGYKFESEIFERHYALPMNLVSRQYSFSGKSVDDLNEFLRAEKRLIEKDDGCLAAFSVEDALLSMIH